MGKIVWTAALWSALLVGAGGPSAAAKTKVKKATAGADDVADGVDHGPERDAGHGPQELAAPDDGGQGGRLTIVDVGGRGAVTTKQPEICAYWIREVLNRAYDAADTPHAPRPRTPT